MGRGDSGAKSAIKKHDKDKRVQWRVRVFKNTDPELKALLKDPEFVESLEQMRRGEGRVIHPHEFDELEERAARREQESQ